MPSPLGPIQVYDFRPQSSAGRPRTHLLIHGWTAEAAFMAAFFQPLRSRGDRVVAFDLPAHGRTPGPWGRRSASLIDCARCALAVADHIGPIDSIVAHSIGGLVAAMLSEGGAPLHRGIDVERLALLAAPNSVRDLSRRFGRELHLGAAAQACYERHVERVGRRPVATFSTGRLLGVRRPQVLVVHARDDAVVPFSDACGLIAEYPAARLAAVDGLGHAGVLFAPPVVRLVRDFVVARQTEACAHTRLR